MLNTEKINTALFVSAHPDDTEFGAGALVKILIDAGVQVQFLILSNPTESLPAGFDDKTLIKEQMASAATYSLAESDVEILNFPVRNFPPARQDILDILIKKRTELSPDLVVTHSASDIHQDHNTVANEVLRAFKNRTILAYTHPWNSRTITGNAFFELSKTQLEQKIRALECFESQKHRHYCQPHVIQSLAVEAGVASGFNYAERFEIVTMSVAQ